MIYQITISHDFKDLDELARYFATTLSEIEKQRDELVGFKDLDEVGDSFSGVDYQVELIEKNN